MSNLSSAVEKLVVARHGAYQFDGGLSTKGRTEVEKLTGQIKTFMGTDYLQRGVTLVLSSEAKRAIETAEIISNLLGLTYIITHALGDEKGKAFMGDLVAKELVSYLQSYQGIIAVTHRDQTNYLPPHLHPNPQVKGHQGALPYAWAHGYDQSGQYFGLTPEKIFPPRDN